MWAFTKRKAEHLYDANVRISRAHLDMPGKLTSILRQHTHKRTEGFHCWLLLLLLLWLCKRELAVSSCYFDELMSRGFVLTPYNFGQCTVDHSCKA